MASSVWDASQTLIAKATATREARAVSRPRPSLTVHILGSHGITAAGCEPRAAASYNARHGRARKTHRLLLARRDRRSASTVAVALDLAGRALLGRDSRDVGRRGGLALPVGDRSGDIDHRRSAARARHHRPRRRASPAVQEPSAQRLGMRMVVEPAVARRVDRSVPHLSPQSSSLHAAAQRSRSAAVGAVSDHEVELPTQSDS